MSDPIREQVSAFLDGELPDSETELLLKRLMRDPELRQCFGRYALIGEAMRGQGTPTLSAGFAARVERAIDGHPAMAEAPAARAHARAWWRPFAGAAVAAGVAAVAVVALQQRAVGPGAATPTLAAKAPSTAPGLSAPQRAAVPSLRVADAGKSREALSYTVPTTAGESPGPMPAARLTNYVFAHSQYSSVLGQSNVLSGLLTPDDPEAAGETALPPAERGRVPAGGLAGSPAPASAAVPRNAP